METSYSADPVWVTVVSLCLLLLKCEARAASNRFPAAPRVAARSNNNDDTLLCLDGFMSVYMSKVQFADLPHTIYVQDDDGGGYHQAVAVAHQCHYFLGESDIFVVFTAASHGCFVRRQKYTTSLTVVVMALADRGGVGIVKSIPLICDREIKGANKNPYPPTQVSCNSDGFNITITQNATVPPLNLDAVWISSGQSHNCKPPKRSKGAVTFHFPFTDCGAQSVVADGVITYWINIELKGHRQKGSIFRDTPFNFTVRCSFALEQTTRVGVKVQGENAEHPSTLRSRGILRANMRFAKDSSYSSFYSSRDPPVVTELGQPVHAEVFVLKLEDGDLELLLDDCWATATENPHDPQRWKLLVKGCPFAGDSHRSVVLPVVSSKKQTYPSLRKRFVVKMFSFVKPLTFENQVYFHCDVEICKRPDCSRSCSSGMHKSRRMSPEAGRRILHSVVSGGPLLYLL